MGEYAGLITKGTTPRDKSGRGTVNFVKVENISEGVILPGSKISVEEHEAYLQRSKLKENDILISIAGTLGRVGFVNKTILPANTNQALAIVRDYKFNRDFLLTSLNGNTIKSFIRRNPTIGAQPNLSLKQIENFQIYTPLPEEQKLVGHLFSTLDTFITLQQSKSISRKLILKTLFTIGISKNMKSFSTFDCIIPTNSWEQRKLGEIGKTFNGLTGKTKDDFGHGEAGFVTYVNVFNNPIADFKMVENIETDNKQNQVEYGDIFFTTSSEIPEEVGMSSVWLGNQSNIYLNSFCFGYRPIIDIDLHYMSIMLRSSGVRRRFILLAQGISRYNISKTKAMDIAVPMPKIDEQISIGIFFKNINYLITLQQCQPFFMKIILSKFIQKFFHHFSPNISKLI